MGSTQVTLVDGTVALVPLDAPATRVVLTVIGGTPAAVIATADGSLPIDPSNDVEVSGSQRQIPGVLGAQRVLSPPLYGDHMENPTIRLLSAGIPTVLLEW